MFFNFENFQCQNIGNLKNERLSAKAEKGGPYRVIRTGYWPIRLQESRSVSVAINKGIYRVHQESFHF